MSASQVNRFEVIDDSGRVLVRRPCEVKLSVQDRGRTLKVFVKGGSPPAERTDQTTDPLDIEALSLPVYRITCGNWLRCPITADDDRIAEICDDAAVVPIEDALAVQRKLVAEIDRLRSASSRVQAPQPTDNWQPIETAPKDGSSFLLVYAARDRERVTIGKWSQKRQAWWCDVGDVPATSWQPIPDLPAAARVPARREEP